MNFEIDWDQLFDLDFFLEIDDQDCIIIDTIPARELTNTENILVHCMKKFVDNIEHRKVPPLEFLIFFEDSYESYKDQQRQHHP